MPTPREDLYTTTFAVRKELKDPLREGLQKMGLTSFGDLMTMVAKHGDEVAQALAPTVAKFKADAEKSRRGRGRAQIAKETLMDATPEELEQLKQLLSKPTQG